MSDGPERLIQVCKALCIGILLDLAATLVVGMLLGLLFALGYLLLGIPDEQVGERIRALAISPFWLAVSALLGAAISMASGFVAAHLLRFNIFPWLGLMGTLLALTSYASNGSTLSDQLAMAASLLTLASVMVGGWLWQWAQS